ncbi:hypothetical protein L218DRAFT_958549 [Marasmius fiardii PR-910]|nr:hypothetical protein L218DRAFT_958549 [Marasmius fiardii PR-910]
MQIFSFVIALLFSVAALAAEPPTELKVESTYTPPDCSVKAKKGDQIEVHYVATRGGLIPLAVGVGQVIKGWDQGLVGMCVGEKRTLTIPPDMAYGARGAGGLIPPNSALVFETELMKLNGKEASRDEL